MGASIIAMGLGVVGCGNMDNTTSRAPGNYPQQVRMNNNDMTADGRYRANNSGRVVGYTPENLAKGTNNMNDINYKGRNDVARTVRIQSALDRLNGYKDLTCVVNGDTAIVGCTPQDANNAEQKTKIVNIVKKCDPSITRCEVVSTRDGIERINSMAENLRKGNMMSTLSSDFKKMLDDIVGY